MLKLSENNSENSSGDEDVMEDWSTSYFLSQLSPLFLLFSDRFLPVRPMFCVCFVLLWPSVLLVFSVLSLFLRLCFCLWSLVQSPLCPIVSVFPGVFSFVRSSSLRLLVFPLLFFFPSSSSVRSSWCVLCVSFPWCVLFVGFLCSFRSLRSSSGLPPLRP